MAQTPNKSQPPASPAPMTRRAHNRRQREQRRQQLVIIFTGAAIGVALLAVLLGVAYDRLWIPSRPVAEVGDVTLSRGGYQIEHRNEIARRMAQSLQLISMFGGQFASQFEGQIAQLELQVPFTNSSLVDEETISGWIDRQVIIQNGAKEFNIQVNDGEVAQALVGDLGRSFTPPPTITDTATLSPTDVLSATTEPATEAPSDAVPSATIGGPTATAAATATQAATETPAPTTPPTATPLADAALQEQDAILGRIYDSYKQQINQSNPGAKPALTLDDFKAGLHDQYLRQVWTNKIEAQLLPEASFTPSTDPSGLETRHILIAVTGTISDTQQQRDAAFAARKPEAEAILQQLRNGADFATLVNEKSDDYATRDKGGDLPAFDKDGKTQDGKQIDAGILNAALALKENEISDLIQTSDGWDIIQLVRRNVDSKETQLQNERTKKFDTWLSEKRAATSIQHFPAITPSPTPPPTTTPASLPTVQLYATATATAIPTDTNTLTETTTLTVTPTVPATPIATIISTATVTTTGESAPAPTAILPEPTATPKPE